MTVLCGGGVSGPKAGIAETIIYTTGALASLLNNKGGAWALVVAPLLGVLAYDATALCEVDPPADPGMTAADYQHLLKLDDLGAVATAIAKLADLAKIAIWYEVCECKTVGTPAAPPALWLPPAGIANPYPVSSAPCWEWSGVQTAANYAGGTPLATHFKTYPLPPAAAQTITQGTGPAVAIQAVELDPAWTDISLQLEWVDAPAHNSGVNVSVSTWATTTQVSTNQVVTSEIFGSDFGAKLSDGDKGTVRTDVLQKWVAVYMASQNASSTLRFKLSLQAYCGHPGLTSEPCLSDPAAMALLGQILSLVQLIQRQHVPFAYVPGGVHTDLTGSGSIAVSGLLGYTVELTTIPDYLGVTDETPDTIWSAGTTRWGTPDGWGDRRFISAPEMFVPVRGDVTRIGYTLAGGVVATIREHVRES